MHGAYDASMARFLCTLLLTLSTCSPPAKAPAEREPQVVAAAQAAFADWQESLPGGYVRPLHMDHAVVFLLALEEPPQQGKIILKADFRSDILDKDRMRIQMDGSLGTLGDDITGMLGPESKSIRWDLLLDGEEGWFRIVAPEFPTFPEEGLAFRFQQELLEDHWQPAMAVLSHEYERLAADYGGPEGFQGIFHSLWPARLVDLLHPNGAIHPMLRFLECVGFREAHGIVEVDLRLDMRPGSPMDEFLRFDWEQIIRDSGEGDVEMMMIGFRAIPQHLMASAKFDAHDGTFLELSLNLALTEKDFEQDLAKSDLQIDLTILGTHRPAPEDLERIFLPPDGFETAADISGLLQLNLVDLHDQLDQHDSEGDFSF